jgi:hypothetical protein
LVEQPRHTHKLTPLPFSCVLSALRLSHLKLDLTHLHITRSCIVSSQLLGLFSDSYTRTSNIAIPHSEISNKRILTRALQEMGRGGRGGGSRNPANQPREVQVSRKISWLLRHGAASEGLKLGKGGYVNVQDAVSHANAILASQRKRHVFFSLCAILMNSSMSSFHCSRESG